MPLTRSQIEALKIIASTHNPETYVAGATPLKVIAAGNRRELRDLVDLVTIHETILPLGAAVWAAVEKSPGFTPEGLIAEIRRNMHYPREAWDTLASQAPLDSRAIMERLRAALDEAEAFVVRMPTDKIGRLFLREGRAVQPDPADLAQYLEHTGTRRGHWPSTPEAAAAAMAAVQKP